MNLYLGNMSMVSGKDGKKFNHTCPIRVHSPQGDPFDKTEYVNIKLVLIFTTRAIRHTFYMES